MNRDSAKLSYSIIQEVRDFLYSKMNIKSSMIPLDILLVVMSHHRQLNNPLSVKKLLAECQHSATGVRYYLDGLISDHWIKVTNNPHDKRMTILQAGPKLIRNLEDFYVSHEHLFKH
jgi:predicted transcriptional regulator